MAREMKDSGVEWIRQIPKDWKILKNKNCFTLRKEIVGNNFDEYNLLSLTKLGIKIKDKNDFKGKVPENYGTYQNVKKGELVLCLFDLDCSAVFSGLSEYEGMISPAYKVYNCNENIFNNFAKYWFEYCFIERKYKIYSKSLRYVVNSDDFGGIEILVPPLEEQEKIANYLDKKVSDIDLIIEKTKATIEDYKKYKQSIITEAVTKGINPNVEMKDSGIEWIGEIPKHWSLRKFRNILVERNEKNSPVKTNERLSLSIDKGVTLYAEKTTNLDRFKDDVSLYKLAYENDIVFNSMNMIVGAVGVSKYFGCVSPVYYTFYDILENSPTPKFCEYVFLSKTIRKVLYSLGKGILAINRGDDKINTCRLKVSKDDLKDLTLPLPSKVEQQQIISYLDKKTTEIDTLITKKEALIAELEEYKKSLIYECVTGKKEIK